METTDYYHKLLEYNETNQPLWQVFIVQTDGSSPARAGMKMLISTDGLAHGNLGGGDMEHKIIAFVREKTPSAPLQLSFDLGQGDLAEHSSTSMICGGSASVFIEPLFNPNHLFIIGAGHCGKALGQLAKLCGFRVRLIDNREDILRTAPLDCYHEKRYSDFINISAVVDFGPHSWIVIMTHGHVHDKEVLQQCLTQESRYLGMIGSKTKVAQTFATLPKQGFTTETLAKVHAPIGMRIGSQSPYEIAISIMAEIIAELRLA
jgi:xanthine dehydrogenase accessory factor